MTAAATLLLLLGVSVWPLYVLAVIPTGVMSLALTPQSRDQPQFAEQLCSPSINSGWGVPLPARHDSRWKRLHSLSTEHPSNREGCTPYILPSTGDDASSSRLSTLVIADRGNCSFVHKALLAQASGAKGLIIRGTKKAVYEAIASHNSSNTTAALVAAETDGTTLNAVEKPVFEYDCSRGEGFVTQLAVPIWQTDARECSANPKCTAKTCVLTGVMAQDGATHQVCCMWDTYVLMGAANRTVAKSLTIPVVYVTVADGQRLQRVLDDHPTSLVMRTYRRQLPFLDLSSVLLWAIGVATALGAAYYSANPMRRRKEKAAAREHRKLQRQHDGDTSLDEEEDERADEPREDVWELDAKHAVAFIALAGVFLTVFYYVKIGGAIPVLFCLSGAATLTQVVAAPALEWLIPSVASREVILPLLGDTARISELLGLVPSGVLAGLWYAHRRTYWPLQDLMGISLCFVFLRTVQLPNLKVATVLLTLAFCYDVFFVFLSPAFFGSSVMEDVATGGPAAYTKSGYPGVDYCERYPRFPACEDPEPMPMLLVLPRVLDWAGGVSMLGLGDIILPGMLLSFALRFDYSDVALGGTTNYFRLMAIGYAVGLAMANLAVTLTEMGQPALMYLVPTTLGTLLVASRRNGDYRAMWSGAGLDQDDDYGTRKKRSSDGAGYSTVDSAAPQVGIAISDPIGRSAANESSRGGDHVPLLGSSAS